MLRRMPTDRGKGLALARTALACLLAIALDSRALPRLRRLPARALSEIKREGMPGATDPDDAGLAIGRADRKGDAAARRHRADTRYRRTTRLPTTPPIPTIRTK